MLSEMDSMELSEWMAFFVLRSEKPDTEQNAMENDIKNQFDMYNAGVK